MTFFGSCTRSAPTDWFWPAICSMTRGCGLKQRDVQVVEALRQYALRVHVDWVVGNHDPPVEWFAGLLGIIAQEEVLLDAGGSQYLVYHGHGWDPSLAWPHVVVDAADAIYFACQWLDPSHRLARRLKRTSKHFCHVTEALRRCAIAEAQNRGLAGVILGHSHLACEEHLHGVHYLNCGCWTEKPSSFVGVNDNGARLYDWDPVGASRSRAVTCPLEADRLVSFGAR